MAQVVVTMAFTTEATYTRPNGESRTALRREAISDIFLNIPDGLDGEEFDFAVAKALREREDQEQLVAALAAAKLAAAESNSRQG